MKSSLCFPRNFVWKVATAAAQIEGAAFEDSKGESVWDRFSGPPGKVLNDDFRHRKVRYRGLAKNTAQLHTVFALAALVLVQRTLHSETRA